MPCARGRLDPELARHLLAEAEPSEALTIAECGVYGVDTTVDLRPDAETLPDRSQVYSTSQQKAIPGHQSSWLGRIVSQAPAWFAPRDVERVTTHDPPAGVAARQVLRLAATLVVAGALSVVVADSGYAKAPFLAAFVGLTNLCVLVRLPCNRVLYGEPPAPVTHPKTGKRAKKGRPPVHGAKFRLKTLPTPERHVEFPLPLGKGSVCVSAWGQLHFKEVPRLLGTVVRVEFFTPEGQPKYLRPLWLFWSGHRSVPLDALCQMYLARFGIEHFFRFAKQRLGLLSAKSPTLQLVRTGGGWWPWRTRNCCWRGRWSRPCPARGTSPGVTRNSRSPPDRCSGHGQSFPSVWAHRPRHPDPVEKHQAARTVSTHNRDPSSRSCPKSGKTKWQLRPRRAHVRRNCKGSTNSTRVSYLAL